MTDPRPVTWWTVAWYVALSALLLLVNLCTDVVAWRNLFGLRSDGRAR